MARQRNPKRDEAREIWEEDKSRSLKSIADELGITGSTIRKWKSEDNWEQLETDDGAPVKKSAPKKKSTKRSAPIETERSDTVADVMELQQMIGLTERQRRFADAYIETDNQTEAARRAGYSNPAVAGSRLMRNVNVAHYLNERLYNINSGDIMSADEVMRRLSAIGRGVITETVVVSTPVGAESVEKPADFKTQIAAMKEILRRYPNNDMLLAAQVRRAAAEALIAETKAERLNADQTDNEQTMTTIMDALKEAADNDR